MRSVRRAPRRPASEPRDGRHAAQNGDRRERLRALDSDAGAPERGKNVCHQAEMILNGLGSGVRGDRHALALIGGGDVDDDRRAHGAAEVRTLQVSVVYIR